MASHGLVRFGMVLRGSAWFGTAGQGKAVKVGIGQER